MPILACSVLCRLAAPVPMVVHHVIVRVGGEVLRHCESDSDHHVIARSDSDVAILLCNKSIQKIIGNQHNNTYLCRFAKDLTKIYTKSYITMNKNNSMNWEAVSYETPSVNVLDVQAEGVLCGSYYLGGGGVYGDDDMNDNGEY